MEPDKTELYTVGIYELSGQKDEANTFDKLDLNQDLRFIDQYSNMVSARVSKGKTVEFNHSNLVAAPVKFRSVIDYSNHIKDSSTLGLLTLNQTGYISKSEPSSPASNNP